jgi:hypothetical protein
LIVSNLPHDTISTGGEVAGTGDAVALDSLQLAQAAQPAVRVSPAPAWIVQFRKQFERCFKMPTGGDGRRVDVAFEVRLKRDGMLDGDPIPKDQPSTPFSRALQKSVARALVDCQPYNLPAASYDQWKMFVSEFVDDPAMR